MGELLTDSELMVIKVIWHSSDPMTIQEISEKVNMVCGKEWDFKTVSVFLHRISNKGYLTKKRVGHTFYYYPLMTEKEYAERELHQCISKCSDAWDTGRVELFFSAIRKNRPLSEEEKQQIRGMIDGME